MDDLPNLRVITIVFDEDSDDIEINYDAGSMNRYEAWGIIKHAYKIVEADFNLQPIEDYDEDED